MGEVARNSYTMPKLRVVRCGCEQLRYRHSMAATSKWGRTLNYFRICLFITIKQESPAILEKMRACKYFNMILSRNVKRIRTLVSSYPAAPPTALHQPGDGVW